MDGKCTGTSTPTELRESQDSMTRDAHLDGYFVGKSLTKSKDPPAPAASEFHEFAQKLRNSTYLLQFYWGQTSF